MHSKLIIIQKSLHILLIIILVSTALTAMLNITVFSKENLMQTIDFTLSVTNINLAPTDSLFIARIIRQQLWEIHYILGMTLTILAIFVAFLYGYGKYTQANIYRVTAIIILAFSGSLLDSRKDLNIPLNFVDMLRNLHWVFISLLGISLLFHIFTALKEQSLKSLSR